MEPTNNLMEQTLLFYRLVFPTIHDQSSSWVSNQMPTWEQMMGLSLEEPEEARTMESPTDPYLVTRVIFGEWYECNLPVYQQEFPPEFWFPFPRTIEIVEGN